MCISTAFAAETKGSITINFNNKCNNMKMHLVKVADIIDGECCLYDKYSSTGIDLNKIETANDLKNASEKLAAFKESDATQVTDNKGITVFKNLDEAVYLIYAEPKEKQDQVEPALISIPTWNEEEGTMMLDVELFPKHVSKNEPPKTGDTNNNLIPLGMALVLSGVAGSICLYLNKKNKKKDEHKEQVENNDEMNKN